MLIISCLLTQQITAIVILERTGKRYPSEKQETKTATKEYTNPHMPEMIRPSKERSRMTQEFAQKNLADVFTEIYKENFWLGNTSLSGQGSTLATTTAIRDELPKLIEALKIGTILDAGCGDYYWMHTIDLKKCHYIGIDIVSPMIEKNKKHYGDAHHNFLCLNLAEDKLPQVDMIICRDVLAHLDYKTVCNILRNCKASGSTFLLATTHMTGTNKKSIIAGDHCPYNLTSIPFNLPEPLIIIEETTAETEPHKAQKAMGLWLLRDLDLTCLEY